MSADLLAYKDCEWQPTITVVNPDGTRERKQMRFELKEGAKIYIDTAVYDGVSEPGPLTNYISEERLRGLWEDD